MEIIKEKRINNYPEPVALESTQEIIEQMKNTICKIYLENGIKCTGFFC